jgi:hypothetical protein
MRTLFAPRDASHNSRVSSVHLRRQKYPSTTHLDLACNHRNRVGRISLQFQSTNGGVHRRQRARQDSCSSVGSCLHGHKFSDRDSVRMDRLSGLRTTPQKAIALSVPSGCGPLSARRPRKTPAALELPAQRSSPRTTDSAPQMPPTPQSNPDRTSAALLPSEG